MMNFLKKNKSGLSFLVVIMIGISFSLFQSSCTTKDECFAPQIDSLTFRDSLSSINYLIPGRVVTIHGEDLNDATSVVINHSYLDPSYMLVYEQSITFLVPGISTSIAGEDMSDSIRVIKDCGEALFMVNILNAPPYIKKISNEYAIPGDTIELEGKYFSLLQSVTFPGDVQGEILEGYTDSTCEVIVPNGAVNSGDIELKSKSGTGSMAYGIMFHDRVGLVCNFDDENTWLGTGGDVISSSDVPDLPGANGYFFKSTAQNIAPGTLENTSTLLDLDIDRNLIYAGNLTPDYFAIKLEALLTSPWTSGAYHIEMGKKDDEGNVEYAYKCDYKPWESDTIINFSSPWTRWKTVSIPLSQFILVDSEDIPLQSYAQLRVINYMHWEFINPADEEDGGGSTIPNFGLLMDNIRIKQVIQEDQ